MEVVIGIAAVAVLIFVLYKRGERKDAENHQTPGTGGGGKPEQNDVV